jgi:hypothetical protein
MGMLPVWLAGDPVNGIGTAAGFLIFLIIGRSLRLRQLKNRKNS